jgi:hypothetical protein
MKFVRKHWGKIVLFGFLIGSGVVGFMFLITCSWIGLSVKEKCKVAQEHYSGDCVEALSEVLGDENNSYGERNDAIWALGQLGDARALPVLREYYTGEIPDREPWNGVISQYELKKAIKLAEGGFNATHWVWKNGVWGEW